MTDSTVTPLPDDSERRIEELAEAFLDDLRAGKNVEAIAIARANPDLGKRLERRLALVERLFRAGRAQRAGGGPRLLVEHAHRLTCPHCGNRIRIIEPHPGDVTCRNCGSSFHVDAQATATYRGAGLGATIGRFEVVELLGRGAFGEVYKARDPELDRFVAIKIPRSESFASPEEEERFLREARSAAGLRHPGIVQVHEIASDGGIPFIVSDYIDGVTLAELIESGRPDFRQVAEIVAQIADALDFAHRQKIVHRDIKPSNILLSAAGKVKSAGGARTQWLPHLSDFGLARRDEIEIPITITGQVLGTAAYMSPEQAAADHDRVDGQSDVYSLGVVLYELITGALPFRGGRRMLLHQVLNDDPQPPRRLNDRVPRDLETICLKAMAKEPGRRYTTAADFADDLRRYLRGEPIRARRVGRVERAWRWSGRNPLPAGLAAGFVLALLAGTIVSTYFALEADERATAATIEKERADTKADESRRNLYISDMRLAEQEWESGHVADALALLERHIPKEGEEDLRGWEWHYQKRLCQQELRRFVEPEPSPDTFWGAGEIISARFSADGRLLATIEKDTAVVLWSVSSGERLRAIRGHARDVECIEFGPDGQVLVTAGADEHESTVRLWDVSTGKELSCFVAGPLVDGRQFARKSRDVREPYEYSPGARTKAREHGICNLAFSPDGTQLTTVSHAGIVSTCDSRSFEVLKSFRVPAAVFHHGPQTRTVFAGGAGRLLTVPFFDEAAVSVWDVGLGTQTTAIPSPGVIHSFTISQDAKRIATRDFTRLELRNLGAREPGRTTTRVGIPLPGHVVRRDMSLAYSPDGSRIAAGCDDGTIKLLDAETGEILRRFSGHTSPVGFVTFSPDGTRLVSGDAHGSAMIWDSSGSLCRPTTIRVHQGLTVESFWDRLDRSGSTSTQTGGATYESTPRDPFDGSEISVIEVLDGRIRSLALSESAGLLAFVAGYEGENDLTICGFHRRVPRKSLRAAPDESWLAVAFRPDGECLAVRKGEESAWLVNVTSGETRVLDGWSENCKSGVLSQDAARIALTTADGLVVYDTSAEKPVARVQGLSSEPKSVRFSPTHRLLAANVDDRLCVWDLKDERPVAITTDDVTSSGDIAISGDDRLVACNTAIRSISRIGLVRPESGVAGTDFPVFAGTLDGLGTDSIAFSPDGKRLLATRHPNNAASIWDVATGVPLRTLRAHSAEVTALAFSPSGNLIVSAGEDGTIRIYDARPRTEAMLVEREALSIAERASSRADLIDRIRSRPNISDAVRRRALDHAEGFWRSECAFRAAALVKSLGEELVRKPFILARLRDDQTLEPDVREEAQRQAAKFKENAGLLNERAWDIAAKPGRSVEDYRRALRWAEAAVELKADDGTILNTLGVAQYRAGELEAALRTLTRSSELNAKSYGEPHPSDVAFLALTLHALGRNEEALGLLRQLTDLVKQEEYAKDPENLAYLREAQEKIGGEKIEENRP